MNQKYVCFNCHTEFFIDDLVDNFDGICDECGCPLKKVEGDTFKYSSIIADNKYQKDLQIMIHGVKTWGVDKIWHNIEKVKDVRNRVKERGLFFKALEILHQKFELWED